MDKNTLIALIKLLKTPSSPDGTITKKSKIQLIFLTEWVIIGFGGYIHIGSSIMWGAASVLLFIYGVLFLGIVIFFIIAHGLMFRSYMHSTISRIFNLFNHLFLLGNLFLLASFLALIFVTRGGADNYFDVLGYSFYGSLIFAIFAVPLGALTLSKVKNESKISGN